MRYRVRAGDFKHLRDSGQLPQKGGSWSVADDYEIREGKIVPIPETDEQGYQLWYSYKPLEDVPDLFLKFARLYEVPDFEAGVLSWCRRYGIPGKAAQRLNEIPRDRFAITSLSRDGMLLSDFRQEVRRAHRTLTLYEAVLNKDEKTAHELIPNQFNDVPMSRRPPPTTRNQ